MNAEKFARFLVDFINSVIEKDSVRYSWVYDINKNLGKKHYVGSIELEEYVISIYELDKDRAIIEFFFELDDQHYKKYEEIIEEIKNIQEFIKITMNTIFDEKFRRYTYMINLKDIEKIKNDINKNDYEVYKAQKTYNL
jgi:hypothetical protein